MQDRADRSESGVALPGFREVAVWSLLLVAVSFWANILCASSSGSLPALQVMMSNVLENGAFDVFAWLLVFGRTIRMSDTGRASWLQIATALGAAVIALAPYRLAPGLALAVLGWLMMSNRGARPLERQLGLVLLALAFEAVWRSGPLALLHIYVGRVDASICAVLLGQLGREAASHGNVVNNMSTDFSITIWSYCTSSLPFGGVALAFMTVVSYLQKPFRLAQVPWLAVSFAGSILLTEIRLVLLATDEASYLWWHVGPGLTLYTMAALSLAVACPILATRESGFGSAPMIVRDGV